MAHMFDIMSTITGQINILSDYYLNKSKSIRKLPEIPEFVLATIDRYLIRHSEIVYDNSKSITVDLCILADTGDNFNPVYLSVVNNITSVIVDKIAIHVDHKDSYGPGIGIFLAIPKLTFDPDADAGDLSEVLKQIYFGVLSLDSNMEYKPSEGLIRVANDSRIDIHTYDIEMTYTAICCMNIVMRKWYDGMKNIEDFTMLAFNDNDLPNEYREKVKNVITLFGTNIANTREKLANGELLKAIIA